MLIHFQIFNPLYVSGINPKLGHTKYFKFGGLLDLMCCNFVEDFSMNELLRLVVIRYIFCYQVMFDS